MTRRAVNLLFLKASKTRILRLIVELTTLILTFYVPELMKLKGGMVRSYFKNVLRLVDERGLA